MEVYLSKIKSIVDQLSIASSFVEDEDIVLLTFNGLPSECDAVKVAIRTRAESISMEDLSALLCSEAIHIEGKLKQNSDLTVAYATIKDSHASNTSRGFNSYHHNRGYSRGDSRGSHRGTRFYSGRSSRGRSQGRGQFGIVCQICGKANHIALYCWHRLDTQFQSSQVSPSQQSKTYQLVR